MEENKTTQNPQPKKDKKSSLFTLLIGFFLIIRGGMRIAEGEIAFMGISMVVVGVLGVLYYFFKR